MYENSTTNANSTNYTTPNDGYYFKQQQPQSDAQSDDTVSSYQGYAQQPQYPNYYAQQPHPPSSEINQAYFNYYNTSAPIYNIYSTNYQYVSDPKYFSNQENTQHYPTR